MPASISDKITSTSSGGVRPVGTTVSTIRSGGATTLICGDLTGWPTDSAVHFVTYTIDGSGEVVAGTQTDWKGIVSGSSINNLTVRSGSDNGNSVGDIVEMLPTAAWGQDLADGLREALNPDGTLQSSIVTTGKINDEAVTSAKLAPSKTTDANGWTVYDFGTWKEYEKTFGVYTTSSLGGGSQQTISASGGNFPVGVVPSSVYMTYSNTAIGGGKDRYVIVPDIDMTSGSAVTTYAISARNITGTTLTTGSIYLTIRLKDK